MRAFLVAALFVSFGAAAQSPGPVDLDRPGALEALQKDNPAHYQTVMERVKAVGGETCESAARIYRTQPEQRTAACRSRQLRTSFPAQTRERIHVGDALYVITIYLDPKTYKLSRAGR
ncbi:MAG: hypothetical protein ACM3SO_15870 [Betaproteobacteria bacterium]